MATDTGLGSFEKGLDSTVNSSGNPLSLHCFLRQFLPSTLVSHQALVPKHKLFTTGPMSWLSLVREQLIKNLAIDEDDFDNTPLLQGRGGAAKAKRVFGELNLLVAQLNEAVAA